jgi:three-Cys-motif partner protein
MATGTFFETRTKASEIKAQIVTKYFWVWSRIVIKHVRSGIGYVDLFAGPGRYADGAASTPLLIIERAIATPELAEALHIVLNDRDDKSIEALRAEVAKLPGIEKLHHKPIIEPREVDYRAVEWVEREWPYPSLIFLDPWGYKGLTLRLIHACLARPYTDVIFFFNYNRVNAAIENEFMRGHIAALLSPERLEKLRTRVQGLPPEERERIVLEELHDAVTLGGRYHWQTFRFTSPEIDKTSHYIILATKNPRGPETDEGHHGQAFDREDRGGRQHELCAVCEQANGAVREEAARSLGRGVVTQVRGPVAIGGADLSKAPRKHKVHVEELPGRDPPAGEGRRGHLRPARGGSSGTSRGSHSREACQGVFPAECHTLWLAC